MFSTLLRLFILSKPPWFGQLQIPFTSKTSQVLCTMILTPSLISGKKLELFYLPNYNYVDTIYKWKYILILFIVLVLSYLEECKIKKQLTWRDTLGYSCRKIRYFETRNIGLPNHLKIHINFSNTLSINIITVIYIFPHLFHNDFEKKKKTFWEYIGNNSTINISLLKSVLFNLYFSINIRLNEYHKKHILFFF